jgi:peptidyl-prolyl cis-trans isomerase D
MITWMQRHRKYLNITLWISVGAFIAAGPMFAIGSGSFSGRSADAVAKVGEVEVSVHQLNTAYRQLFSQYNQMFQGKFDEAQAKAFGLQQQALRQLINESLLLNLAQQFRLEVSDAELSENIAKTDAFFKDGKFDKETYQNVLKQVNLTMSLYEADVRRSLLLSKVMSIMAPQALPLEEEAVATALYIKDKIEFKVLNSSDITVTPTKDELIQYWEVHKNEYMSEPSYRMEMIEQTPVVNEYTQDEIKSAYEKSKHDYTKANGEIKSLEAATADIVSALNAEATNKEALRTYIDYKKGKLDAAIARQEFSVTQSQNPFGEETFASILELSVDKPYLKPQEVDGKFLIMKLLEIKGSEVKSYAEVAEQIKTAYIAEQTKVRMVELAKNSVATFKGTISDFVNRESINKLPPLAEYEAAEFLEALFAQQNKRGYIELKENKIVLFNILEQKLLKKENNTQEKNVLRLKTSLLNDGLLKKLEAQYPVTSYLEGK